MRHKVIFGLILVAVLGGGYFGYAKFGVSAGETQYVLAAAQKGTLITSVSGTGQISVSNQVDIKTKAAGDVLSVNAINGQEVKNGTILAQLNAKDAYKAVRDAQVNLDSANLALAKLIKSTDQLSLLQADNALAQAEQSKKSAEDGLVKAYDDGFNNVSNAFLQLPAVMSGLNDLIYGFSFSTGQANLDYYTDNTSNSIALQFRNDVNSAYQKARTAYDQNFSDYKSASRFSNTDAIESLINETYDTTKQIAEAVKSFQNLIQLYEDELTKINRKPQALADTQLSSLATYIGQTNTHLLNLLSIRTTIQNSKEAIVNAQSSIDEKTLSLANLKAGVDPLDVQSQQLTIRQRESALSDAREKLADYSVRAPFDGVVATVDLKKGDSVSSGAAAFTLITKQSIAEIPLNEVDIAKVKVGQKVNLTFDAASDLTITGEVADIDSLGTVTQGVVTYNVKIVFDTQDPRIKPGMSVSAAIITSLKTDVLLVPNSAIKSSGNGNYVEILENVPASSQALSVGIPSVTPPKQQTVEIGLANDTMTEIVSGLKEGDLVITRTIAASTATTKATQGQSFLPTQGGARIGGTGGANFQR